MALTVDIWSDIACPWCYVGKRKLEGALAAFEHAADVEVRWHAFELDPSTPAEVDSSLTYAERLARKYQMTPERAQEMMDQMAGRAAEDGIEMRFDRLRAGSTFDAHRLLAYAGADGRKLRGALKERLLRAYFTDGVLMSDHGALAHLAGEVGLEEDEAAGVLATDQYADLVRSEESAAAQLGIRGVPFFVFGGKFGVSGAQPVDALLQVLERAWSEDPEPPVTDGDAKGITGAVCSPDSPGDCV